MIYNKYKDKARNMISFGLRLLSLIMTLDYKARYTFIRSNFAYTFFCILLFNLKLIDANSLLCLSHIQGW